MSFICSLKNQKEFNFVNRHGHKEYSSLFILILSSEISLFKKSYKDVIFLGLKVSKNFSRKAVVRNKMRRRIKHLINLLATDTVLKLNGKALIIIPKLGLNKIKFIALQNLIRKKILDINSSSKDHVI